MALPPSFLEFLRSPTAQVVIWCTVLVWIVIVGYYLVQACRNWARGDVQGPVEHLTVFRQIHEEGELSDQEFQTIRHVLSERRMQQEQGVTKPSTAPSKAARGDGQVTDSA